MDKKIIATILAVLLGAAGAIWGFDFKGHVCGNPNAASAVSQDK